MRSIVIILVLALVSTAALPRARADQALPDPEPASDPWTSVPAAVAPEPEVEGKNHHRAIALGTIGGIYVGFSTWAYFAWYRGHPPNQGFKFGGDGLFEVDAYAGGSDKLGHAWATMVLARMTSQVLRLGGWDRRYAALIGAGLSSVLFTLVEVEDAYYYEFSTGDLVADLIGAGIAAAFESSGRADELFDFRVEYWPSEEYKSIVRGDPSRPEADLKALNVAEDYSGQKYLLALHLGAFDGLVDRSRWTSPLRYVDAVIGFDTKQYRPVVVPEEEAVPTQNLTFGVSLNLQAVFDRVLDGGGRKRRGAKAAMHGLTELMNAPFTSYGLGPSRSCEAPCARGGD